MKLLVDFLTPRFMFVIVLWARVECHIGSRMHLHTRAYVKKKPHVPVVTCVGSSVAGLGPQAPCGIRPRLLTNPEPHTWFLRALRPLHLARGRIMAGIWACGHASSCTQQQPAAGHCQRRPRPKTGPKASALPARTQAKASRATAKETRPHQGSSADGGGQQQQ